MARTLARVLAVLNALYQGGIGLLSIVRPATAGLAYQLHDQPPVSLALIRILGGLMVMGALALVVFARDPESNPALAGVLAVGAVGGIAADVLACLAGEIRWAQVGGSLFFQSALLLSLAAYLFRSRRGSTS